MRPIFLMTILTVASILGGCGQKGPLYLPEPALAPQSEAANKAAPGTETEADAEAPPSPAPAAQP